jgi:hypothetical protein
MIIRNVNPGSGFFSSPDSGSGSKGKKSSDPGSETLILHYLLRAEGFFFDLDVLRGAMGIKILQFSIKKI